MKEKNLMDINIKKAELLDKAVDAQNKLNEVLSDIMLIIANLPKEEAE